MFGRLPSGRCGSRLACVAERAEFCRTRSVSALLVDKSCESMLSHRGRLGPRTMQQRTAAGSTHESTEVRFLRRETGASALRVHTKSIDQKAKRRKRQDPAPLRKLFGRLLYHTVTDPAPPARQYLRVPSKKL